MAVGPEGSSPCGAGSDERFDSLPPVGSLKVVAATSRSWLRDFADLAAAQVVASALRFVAVAWVARRLGPEGFGVVAVASVTMGYFAAASLSGLDVIGTRDVAASDRAPGQIAEATTLRLGTSAAVLLVVLPTLALTGLDRELLAAIALFAVTLLPLALDPRWALVGLQRSRPIARAEVLAATVNLIGVVALVRGGGDVLMVPVVQFVSDAARAGVLRREIAHLGARAVLARAPHWRRQISAAVPVSATSILRAAVVTIDVLIVGAMLPGRDAGQYAAASRLFVVGLVFLALYYQQLLPRLVAARRIGADEERRLLAIGRRRALRYFPPLVACASISAPWVVPALLGDEYRQAGRLSAVLVWSLALIAVTGLYNQLLVVHHRQSRITLVVAVALVVNVVGNLVLLPTIGVIGAPIAAVASELVAVVLTSRAARAALLVDG